jgi:hypothetical protein
MAAGLIDEIVQRYTGASPEAKAELEGLAAPILAERSWIPNPGPQTQAYFSKADILLYGGQAGGGKTDLLCGLALHEHHTSLLMRRVNKEVEGLTDRFAELVPDNQIRRGDAPRITLPGGGRINLSGAQHPGSEKAWMGRPRDFLGLDEATHFLDSQVRFLLGWIRTTIEGQRTRAVFATNPPVDAAGQWVVPFFAPWLDMTHPEYPAPHGELRWFITTPDGADVQVDGPEAVQRDGETLRPKSRTFIPAALADNPYLINTDYQASLDALPEPIRSAVRDGNFMAARPDDDWQIIPTDWVRQAQARWTPDHPDVPMCAIGADVARGGKDDVVLSPRYDGWFGELTIKPGVEVQSGGDIAGPIMVMRKNNATPVIDMGGGWGTSPSDILTENGVDHVKYVGAAGSVGRTIDGALAFLNIRAESWWRFREALDPSQDGGSPIALPPDQKLTSDLTAPLYKISQGGKIQVESKEDIIKRLGRSPDRGDAVVMAWHGGPRWRTHETIWRDATRNGGQQKQVILGRARQKRRRR